MVKNFLSFGLHVNLYRKICRVNLYLVVTKTLKKKFSKRGEEKDLYSRTHGWIENALQHIRQREG